MSRLTSCKKPSSYTNHLNRLSGKEWIRFTKSWFVLNPAPRGAKICHPASFPEELAEHFISFFTKQGDWIIDPFAGSGSTLIAARKLGRNSWGIELYEKYVNLTRNRLLKAQKTKVESIIINGDAKNILEIKKELDIPGADFCITSPPYWNQLKRKTERRILRTEKNLDCVYGENPLDLGMIDDYNEFLRQQKIVFDNVYGVMKHGSYLVVITNNIYTEGRLWPLAFDTLKTLSEKWIPKDEKLWCQDNRKLFPFGMFHSYIGNRSHHYCLIFRKEVTHEVE